MTRRDCRVCHRQLYDEPLLRYVNMPRVAQFLPDQSSLDSDCGINLEILQCSGCGLVQLASDPVPYYRDVVRAAGLSEEMRSFRRAQFADLIDRFSLRGKKLLEVGCGRGEYLSLLGEAGAEACGIEHSAASVAACTAAGLNVSEGFIGSPEDAVPGGPFDAFAIFNFLEHLPDPNATLAGIHRNLSDTAVGLVEVPNFDMMTREGQFAEFMSDHLCYYTAATLTSTLSINGFEVLGCTEQWYRYILSAIVRKRRRLDLAGFDARRTVLNDEIHAYIRRFPPRRVAMWGAGHQALALMALFGLQGSIRYVIDSAPFKQGKYTPATHIPIVAPDALERDPVDAVIIAAAGYSDEVARTVRSRFGPALSVVIWRESGLESV